MDTMSLLLRSYRAMQQHALVHKLKLYNRALASAAITSAIRAPSLVYMREGVVSCGTSGLFRIGGDFVPLYCVVVVMEEIATGVVMREFARATNTDNIIVPITHQIAANA